MKILAIETSCDETAVALLECAGDEAGATFRVLGNALLSQIDIHKEYGGVYPAVAKREHAKNLVPLLAAALEEAELLVENAQKPDDGVRAEIGTLLEREPGLADAFFAFIAETERPDIDAIAVTNGPGLEPALWVGVNFAKALSLTWNVPIVSVSHMEGHLLSALALGTDKHSLSVPHRLLTLLISGGHTELVFRDEAGVYTLIGRTRDDAVGEAYDKVARMLGLSYPGGPEVSKLAEKSRERGAAVAFAFPRPMLATNDFDFSFSGLKTSVLYKVKDIGEPTEAQKEELAQAFEDAAGEVLLKKTLRAIEETNATALAIGGGVSANAHLRRIFAEAVALEHPGVSLFIPTASLTGDNAIMIGIAGYFHAVKKEFADLSALRADGNLSFT